jgi:hypothetical protein
MTTRIAQHIDIEGITLLQSKYLFANLSEEDRKNGFVTTPFTIAQIETLLENDGVFVAEEAEKIIGYCFAGSWDFFSQWAIFPYMVARFPDFTFQNQHLTVENSFQYGPVCIDESARGKGVFPLLFAEMRRKMAEKYPLGGTFINQINLRSVKAHTEKIDLEIVDEFSFNGNNYFTLAFFTEK